MFNINSDLYKKELIMSAMEPFSGLIKPNFSSLSKKENTLLEAELFLQICHKVKELFREQYKNFFHTIKLTAEMENRMLDAKFINLVIQDILSTEEYTLKGIAYYTGNDEETIYQIVTGRNTNPSGVVLQKIIALHKTVRKDLYDTIIKKIIAEYLNRCKDENDTEKNK